MNKTVKAVLESQGIDADKYCLISITCNNIKLRHKDNGRVVDLRW